MELKFLTFHIGDEVFAINISKVERVKEYEKTTKMPNIADYVEGIINLMGEIVPIINLRKKFALEDFQTRKGKDNCCEARRQQQSWISRR